MREHHPTETRTAPWTRRRTPTARTTLAVALAAPVVVVVALFLATHPTVAAPAATVAAATLFGVRRRA